MTRRRSDDGSQLTLWALQDDQAVKPQGTEQERSLDPASTEDDFHPARIDDLWEKVFSKQNIERALARVERNGGAPGSDGMTVAELRPHVEANFSEIRRSLDEGTYRPTPVRRVLIPKPGGGKRELGVPTVVDRLIQQAMLEVLSPIFDPHFSSSSFGFRPKKSAHMAVEQARAFIGEGYDWVVVLDLDSFFDRVNHDALMARVARKIGDKKLLKLIRHYLNAGVMVEGVKAETVEGTPQGSPLSPILANIMLDDLDKELEARGQNFVRYADDGRIYVKSERAAQRVLESVTLFIEKRLKLKVNRLKSGVAPATKRGLLGFGFLKRQGRVDVRIDPKALKAMKDRIRQLTARTWGVSMKVRIHALNRFIRGWCAYFALADTPWVFKEQDKWLRRRLRQVYWKQWKRPKTRRRMLLSFGIPSRDAREWSYSRKGSWRIAGSPPMSRALPTAHFTRIGLAGFKDNYGGIRDVWRTA